VPEDACVHGLGPDQLTVARKREQNRVLSQLGRLNTTVLERQGKQKEIQAIGVQRGHESRRYAPREVGLSSRGTGQPGNRARTAGRILGSRYGAIVGITPSRSTPVSEPPRRGMSKRVLTTESGAPVADNQNSQTAGPHGPVLLQDQHLIEKLAR